MSRPLKNISASCLIPGAFDENLTAQAAKACREKLGGAPDLVVAFVTSDYQPHLKSLIETLRIDGHAPEIVGCSTCGLAGVGREQERISGISLLFLKMPSTGVTITSTIPSKRTADAAVVLSNPLDISFESILEEWGTHHPGIPIVGGSATGGPDEDDLFLFTHHGICREDRLIVEFSGGIKLEPLVSHGCRPIGQPFVITAAKGCEVYALGQREPFDVLEEAFASLGNELQEEAEGNIFAGLVIEEASDEFQSGDFHIHQIVSATLNDGRLTLGAPARIGQTMQFQLRDSLVAEKLLESECERIFTQSGAPFASLLFMGQGRGKRLFGADDRNIRAFEDIFGQIPLAGIYSFSEVGTVDSKSLRYNHSVCGALFYSAD
ncbi:MAG: FIST N-terminal domain-containing protein [Verrucomicrobiales bacterium]|nr:FIST N-terminal domain-containing protein [Verrucomicrobiales bacterium]